MADKRTVQLPPQSYYKRTLPSSCIAFDSIEGKKLFRQALDENNLETYFSLSLQYLTQSEPAFCGLGTLCMVLNALEIDPMRQWKGCWRWYDETMLDCCRPLDEIKQVGITLPEFVCIARCNRLRAMASRADQSDKEKFIRDLKLACQHPSKFMVVSYDRGTLGQTGTGHFSPVGGYCEKENMVLIMDVARFKYPAYWVSIDLLWNSLHPVDVSTGKPRGYVLLSKGKKGYAQSALIQLSCNKDSWPQLYDILFKKLPKKVQNMNRETTIEQFLSLIISSIPDKYYSVVDDRFMLFVSHPDEFIEEDPPAQCPQSYVQGLDELLNQLKQTELYQLVFSSLDAQRKLTKLIKETEMKITTPIGKSPHLIMRTRKSLVNLFSNKTSRSNSMSGDGFPTNVLGLSLPEQVLEEVLAEKTLDSGTLLPSVKSVDSVPMSSTSFRQGFPRKPPDSHGKEPGGNAKEAARQTPLEPPHTDLAIPTTNPLPNPPSDSGKLSWTYALPTSPKASPTLPASPAMNSPKLPASPALNHPSTNKNSLSKSSKPHSIVTQEFSCPSCQKKNSNSAEDVFISKEEPVNDFLAFLTMFLYALFSYCPSLYENLAKSHENDEKIQKTIDQIRKIVRLNHQDPALYRLYLEIEFLKEQIASLTELVESDQV